MGLGLQYRVEAMHPECRFDQDDPIFLSINLGVVSRIEGGSEKLEALVAKGVTTSEMPKAKERIAHAGRSVWTPVSLKGNVDIKQRKISWEKWIEEREWCTRMIGSGTWGKASRPSSAFKLT